MAAFWTIILGILILAAAVITMGLIIAWKIGHALTEYDDYDIDKNWVYEERINEDKNSKTILK